MVELQQVSKRFGAGAPVLDRITLQAAAGEFISVIGPSGCGKSTLLRLVAGLTPLSGGALRTATPDTSLSFVFQDPTLLPWLTAEDNVALPLRLERPTRPDAALIEGRVQDALALVGLTEKAGAYPRELSGGQRMRVSLARALVTEPRLLLLDEPFGALDEITREQLNEELLALRERQQWTAFFVTHSVSEAVFLSSRILVLSANPGRVHREIAVPLAYPRTAEIRLEPGFHALVNEVSRALRDVMSSGGDE